MDARVNGEQRSRRKARALCLDLNETLTTRAICLAGTLFLLTGYSGYLGWQWRSVRTIAQEIRYAQRRRIRERRVGSG